MPFTRSKLLYNIIVTPPKSPAKRATAAAILSRPRLSTEQALKGYDYLRSRSSRGGSGN